MVKAFILSENKSPYRHAIKVMVIMKHGGWIQELSYTFHDKHRWQKTMPLNLEELDVIRGM